MKRGRQGQKYAEGEYNLTVGEWAKLKHVSDESVRKRIIAGLPLIDWEPRIYKKERKETERLYTPEETVKQYRSAAKKAGQIMILADCNQMRAVDVVEELVENGVAVNELPQGYRKKFGGGRRNADSTAAGRSGDHARGAGGGRCILSADQIGA